MDFNLSEDQLLIKDVADRMFADLCADDRVRQEYAAERAFHKDLWQQIVDAGLLGTSLPENVGGSGFGLTETCLLLEAQGRSVAPIPLLETLVECALPLARCDAGERFSDTLKAVCSGERILTAVRPYKGLQSLATLKAHEEGEALILDGASASAAWAPLAQQFLVNTENAGKPVVMLIDADTPGIRLVEQKLIGGICAAVVHFDKVRVESSALVASGDAAAAMLDVQSQLTLTALAAQQVGILHEGLRRTAVYDNERKQFGKSLSSFQAVAHQAADAYMEIEALRGVYWRALDDIDSGRDARLAAHSAKIWLCRAGHKVAHTVLHLHGGMGQDLEYPIHRFFTWAKRNERYLGSATDHSLSIGQLIACDSGSKLALAA